jgi:glycosyltransferase involved in cell wall biosynthesis
MAPFFTVVVPSLNQGKFLDRALQSLLSQRSNDLEIIVIDGGSTDGSVEIIQKYATLLGGVRFGESSVVAACGRVAAKNKTVIEKCSDICASFIWCSEPDRGQSHAFNKGFARACGHFLFWLNADDLLLPGTLACVQTLLAARRELEWIAGNQIYIDVDGKIIQCSRGNRWHDFLYRKAPVHVYGPSSFFSRELWHRVGGTDERLRYCMDWDLWLRFWKAGVRFERLNHYCWALRRHDGSKTQGGERDKEDVHWKEIYEMCQRNGLSISQTGVWLQRGWRLVSGCYVLSMIDTWRRHGMIMDR